MKIRNVLIIALLLLSGCYLPEKGHPYGTKCYYQDGLEANYIFIDRAVCYHHKNQIIKNDKSLKDLFIKIK